MTTLVRNELRKLATVRSTWLFVAIPPAIIIAGIVGFIVSGGADSPTAVRSALAHAGVPALITLVLGITAVAGEYRHKTITDAYLASPGRTPVIVAKLVAYTLVGGLIGVINAVTTLAVSAIALSAENVPFDATTTDVWRTLIGGVGFNAAYAAAGVSLGALIRNTTAAVTVALAWIAVVEGIVGQLVGDLGRWLPNRSAFAMAYMPNPDLLPQWGGAIVLVGYVAVFAVLAAATTVRRDVT